MNPRERIALLGHYPHLHGRISLEDCRKHAKEKPAKQDLDYLRAACALSWSGPRRQVLEPPWLREQVVRELGEPLALYDEDEQGPRRDLNQVEY